VTALVKIVIIADSLALPRPPEAGLVHYEETYPVLLQRLLGQPSEGIEFLVAERGKRFRTMADCVRDWTEVVAYRNPRIVVVQTGIVDCAPRVFSQTERQFIERIRPRLLQRLVLAVVARCRPFLVRLRKNRVYEPLDGFAEACRNVIERARNDGIADLFFLNILTPTAELDARSPGYISNQRAYNDALTKACAGTHAQVLDIDGAFRQAGGTAALTVDGMHPNASGHRMIAIILRNAILNTAQPRTAHA